MSPKTLLATAAAAAALFAQPPQGQRPPGGRPAGGAPRGPEPVAVDDRTGFVSIFDGTLKGWDGDPDYWRVEGDTIVGESTKEKPLKSNTFLIWRGDEPGDFELKLEYRMNSTNSGVQYRSVQLPDAGKWVLKGYQADLDFQNTYTGLLYEERGRGFLAPRGTFATIRAEGERPKTLANLKPDLDLRGHINVNGWNTIHVIARGNMLYHIYNGQLFSAFVDDDMKNRAMKGLIGLQLHVGAPMKVEFRNIYIKK